jgi:hypothetical protein
MKTRILLLLLFIASYSFSQSVNDYKGVIIPMKYDFLKTENQYRLQTITKMNLQKAGFQAFYSNEQIPADFTDRCSLLYVDVKKDNAFLISKLYVVLKDCYGAIVFQSAIGKSREKEFETAYADALNQAFISVYALNYKYNGNTNFSPKSGIVSQSVPVAVPPAVSVTPAVVVPEVVVPAVAVSAPVSVAKNEPKISEGTISNMLYAQPTSYGYQLIDSEPKVVMKVYKTSNPASFMATKGSFQGVLVSKDNQWFFEYYQNDKLISEKIEVKF